MPGTEIPALSIPKVALALSPTASAQGEFTATVRLSTATCPSVATSSPVMGGNSVFRFEEYLEVKAILGH